MLPAERGAWAAWGFGVVQVLTPCSALQDWAAAIERQAAKLWALLAPYMEKVCPIEMQSLRVWSRLKDSSAIFPRSFLVTACGQVPFLGKKKSSKALPGCCVSLRSPVPGQANGSTEPVRSGEARRDCGVKVSGGKLGLDGLELLDLG